MAEPGPARGFFLLQMESFSHHCLLGGVKLWGSVVSRDSLGCNRCSMNKVEFNRLNFYRLTKRRNGNNIFQYMIAPKLFMTMSLLQRLQVPASRDPVRKIDGCEFNARLRLPHPISLTIPYIVH